jgi:hypothetical protein
MERPRRDLNHPREQIAPGENASNRVVQGFRAIAPKSSQSQKVPKEPVLTRENCNGCSSKRVAVVAG